MVAVSMSSVFAAAPGARKQQGGTLTGIARGADNAPLPNHCVRVRRADEGRLAGSTKTNQTGEYTFTNLAPADYIVEVDNCDGKILGMSPAVHVPAGGAITVNVTGSAAGALSAAGKGGFSLFGLGKLASVGVIGAGAAIAVAGVVATRDDASPSR
jgi:hypothetical protein